MVLKEKKNEEEIIQEGDKFVYTQERRVDLEAEDLLQMATRERTKLDEHSKTLEHIRKDMKRINDFLSKNKKLIEAAKTIESQRFCEKCGMDFSLEANKNMKSPKTKEPYKYLCKNCAIKEGL